jgi:formate hydrogenlyase transcriptional activator
MLNRTDPPTPFLGREQRVLALAALFEGDFSLDWIVDITDEKASQVLTVLEENAKKHLLIRKGIGRYRFAESDKANYWQDRLSPDEKEKIRHEIVRLISREVTDETEKLHLIAEHLLHTTNDLEDCRWLVKAGDSYLKIFQTENALNCYSRALKDLSLLGAEQADSMFAEATISYSKISPGRHDITTVLSVIDEALLRAKRSGLGTLEALLNLHLAKNEWYCAQYDSAWKHFNEGWSIVKDLGDDKLLRSATTLSTFFLFWQGRFQEAVNTYEKSVSDVERFPQGGFPLLASITVGSCYVHIGQVTQGLGMLDAIRTYCQKRGDIYMKAFAGCSIGNAMLDLNRVDDAIQHLESSVAEAMLARNDWVTMMSRLMLSFAYYLTGQDNRASVELEGFLQHSNRVHLTVPFPYLLNLCLAMEQGKLALIKGLTLEDEVRRITGGQNILMKGVAYRHKAFLEKQRRLPHGTVMGSLRLSLRCLEESGDRVEKARTLFDMTREYLSADEQNKAKETMLKASTLLSSLGGFREKLIPDDLSSLISEPLHGDGVLKEILKLGQEVVTIRDDKDIVQLILSTVNRIAGAERGAIFLTKKKGDSLDLVLRASKNLTAEQISHPAFHSSMKMIEDVAKTGKGLLQGIIREKSFETDSFSTIRSRICVPMFLRDSVVGVLYHDNRLLSSAFKESDLELLAYFAALAGFALDNAQAYEEIQNLNRKLYEENRYYEEQHLQEMRFDEIIGESASQRAVMKQVLQVAKSDTTVLISGETGVGKELVARAIHRNSHRKDKPFIRVQCSALPESLISTELFGHERGAFTGAVHRRIGRFELANGGTLFLDEIGELPSEVQAHLLRVLQSKEFERVGGSETLHSDFRLIAATNRDLEQLVKENRFRADLFYRINVFPIHVPSLRERKEDIPLLVNHFLNLYSTKLGKTTKTVPELEMDRMMRYDWPGNVRELENIIERGTILSSGPYFHVPELAIAPPDQTSVTADATLEDNERQCILRVLQKTEWKVRGRGGAAEILKINPSTLTSKMKKLGIKRPESLPRRRSPMLHTQGLVS